MLDNVTHHDELPECQASQESVAEDADRPEHLLALQTQIQRSHAGLQGVRLDLGGQTQLGQLPVAGFAETGPILQIDLLDRLACRKSRSNCIKKREMDGQGGVAWCQLLLRSETRSRGTIRREISSQTFDVIL